MSKFSKLPTRQLTNCPNRAVNQELSKLPTRQLTISTATQKKR